MQRPALARALGVSVLAMSLLVGGAAAWAQPTQTGATTSTTAVTSTTSTTSSSTGGTATTDTTTASSGRAGKAGWMAGAWRRAGRADGGRLAWAVTPSNELISFTLRNPGRILSERRVSGLARGEKLVGIDVRPANGKLYAVSSGSRVYTVDPRTARATAVGAPFTPALDGTSFGVDFNPQADRLRVVSDLGQNLRIVPDTGQVAANLGDTPLTYLKGDPGEGSLPRVSASAYTNNVAAAPSTRLFGIDTRRGTVALQNPPNDGTLKTVGDLGVDIRSLAGFDIYTSAGTDTAVASLTPAGARGANLYSVDLTTGRASLLRPIGRFGTPVVDIAVTP